MVLESSGKGITFSRNQPLQLSSVVHEPSKCRHRIYLPLGEEGADVPYGGPCVAKNRRK